MKQSVYRVWYPFQYFMCAAAVAYFIYSIGLVLVKDRQYDFKMYYYVIETYLQGKNPYDPAVVCSVAGEEILPFAYPPVALALFKPLHFLSYGTAYYVFLFTKLLAIGCLILIWRHIFYEETRDTYLFITTLLMGYKCTLILDIDAGNISVFEQVVFWSGIYFLLSKKYIHSSFLILGFSIMKQLSIVFLPIVFFYERSWRVFFIVLLCISIFIGIHALSYFNEPDLYHGFIKNASGLDSRGNENPSSLSLFKDIADNLNNSVTFAYISFCLFALFVIYLLIYAIRKFNADKDSLLLVVFSCIAYAIAVPRMKDYSYILLLMPAMMTIRSYVDRHWVRILLFLLLWFTFFPYQALAVTLFLFVLILWGVRHKARTCGMSPESIRGGSGDGRGG